MGMFSATMQKNGDKIIKEADKSLEKAARMIGGQWVGHAVEMAPKDTGLLANSITFAIGGEAPEKMQYTSDDGEQSGQYSGQAPRDGKGEVSVWVGTNVHYAPHQELGAPSINLKAKPFIRPSMENFKNEYEQILKKCLK